MYVLHSISSVWLPVPNVFLFLLQYQLVAEVDGTSSRYFFTVLSVGK